MSSIVIVPTYNEASNIVKLVKLIYKHSPESHILVVDDNSPDGTGAIAEQLAAQELSKERLHVLHRTEKSGLGRAYLAGFQWALDRDFDVMIEMDADLSHDPMYIQSLLEESETSDVVIGSRYLNGISVINWPLRRILLSWAANHYVRVITQMAVNDCTSGFRLYRRSVLESISLNSVKSNGYSFQVEMSFRAHVAGYRITEVPIIFTERRSGQSKMSKRVIWESVWVPIKLRLQRKKLAKVQAVDLRHVNTT